MSAPQISHAAGSTRIFVFDEVYPFRAAQEQAEKKKLSAFGLLAKINPMRRPTAETVQLTKQELRYEPFWHITATRSIDYRSQATYQVPVHNAYAQQLQIEGLRFDVARQKDKARIEFTATEQCHRKIGFDEYMDGMKREVAAASLPGYIKKYKFTEHEEYENPALLKPSLPLQAAPTWRLPSCRARPSRRTRCCATTSSSSAATCMPGPCSRSSTAGGRPTRRA